MIARELFLAGFLIGAASTGSGVESGATQTATHDASILREKDSFEFVYRVEVPVLENEAYLWLPFATSDAFQEVKLIAIDTPLEWREIEDLHYKNRLLFFELSPEASRGEIVVRYQVERREKSSYPAEERDLKRYLEPERMVPLHDRFRRLAEKAIYGKTSQRQQALALYNHVLGAFRYDKSGVGWGRGDALYACDIKSGNCTDFHAYFIGLSRSVGIPARFAIGATIPAGKSEGRVNGYHCWAEVYVDGEWVPVDISEAWKNPALASYYFGNQPANRFEFSMGRDLVVEPLPANGPINFLMYPILEVNGKAQILIPDLSFKRS